jgi:hypothetical protein
LLRECARSPTATSTRVPVAPAVAAPALRIQQRNAMQLWMPQQHAAQ